MNDDRVLAGLKALADQDRGLEAPPELEARVVSAFRVAQRRRKQIRNATWLAAAAAVALGLFSALPRESQQPAEVVVAPQVEAPIEAVIAPVQIPVKAAAKVRRKAEPQLREVATDFFPLAEAAPPLERGQLLRVIVPASTMRSVGLPVREDRDAEPVEADILIGQEGIARAIRFVRYEQ